MHLEIYAPEYKGDLKGLIQICHGMTEYMGRYVKFTKYFTSRGYIVFGNDIIQPRTQHHTKIILFVH